MKKVLAVFLSVMMLFGALSFSSSAENVSDYFNSTLVDPNKQAIVTFDPAGGTFKSPVWVYDSSKGGFNYVENYSGAIYVMLPRESNNMEPGDYIYLPVMTAPSGYQFDGWFCYNNGTSTGLSATYAANSAYQIPYGSAGTVIRFIAAYSPTEPEADTMETVMNILIKVFGTIVGLLFLEGADAGIKMMEKLLSGIMG